LLSAKYLAVIDLVARGQFFPGFPESEGLSLLESPARCVVVGFVFHPLFEQFSQETRQALLLLGSLDARPAATLASRLIVTFFMTRS
jgi:hypothetical protein